MPTTTPTTITSVKQSCSTSFVRWSTARDRWQSRTARTWEHPQDTVAVLKELGIFFSDVTKSEQVRNEVSLGLFWNPGESCIRGQRFSWLSNGQVSIWLLHFCLGVGWSGQEGLTGDCCLRARCTRCPANRLPSLRDLAGDHFGAQTNSLLRTENRGKPPAGAHSA